MARALATAVVVALLAVSGAGGTDAQVPKRGGTVVVGTLREPACINAFLLRCGDSAEAGHIMRPALRGAFAVGAGFTWRPDLVSSVDFSRRSPFTLTYHIRPEARWSDGVPVTAQDFVFTHEARRSVPANELINWERLHLDVIESVTAVDARTVKIVLRSRFALWRGLFPHVLPRHALRGQDFATVWLDGIRNSRTGDPIGSGPFLVKRWERGSQVTFVRNPRYWGPSPAHLDGIVLRFCRECADFFGEQIARLRAGELDLVAGAPLAAPELRKLQRLRGVEVLATSGPVWEHFHLRLGAGGHSALRQKLVRQALAYGVDRVAIARAQYGAFRPRYPTRDSAVFPSGSAHYRPHWRPYRYRPARARALLERAGCRLGLDRIYVCAGERLSLRFLTTAGDSNRARTIQLVQGRLRPVGIEVRPQYVPSGALLGQIVPSGEFDVVLFSWTPLTPDGPATSVAIYGCGELRNYSGYCRPRVSRDLDEARDVRSAQSAADLLNRADAQLARDVPVIPLFDRPLVAAFTRSLRGVSLETHALNPLANAENWWLDD